MSEADKMFEALGYEKKEYSDSIKYSKLSCKDIEFGFVYEDVSCMDCGYYAADITMSELKAINKKCEELGWLDME